MAEGFASVLKQELAPYKLRQKLIAQYYEGAAVFSNEENGVQVTMKYLSSYTFHSLLCSSIEFGNEASMFHSKISKTIFYQHIRIFVLFFHFTYAFRFVKNCLWPHCPEVCANTVEVSKQGCELGVY
jgi:hypothetical protein